MRRSLGIAVFSGMVGVTIFGIFLTPVFFSVILGLGETKLFDSAAVRYIGSSVVSGLAGSGMGFLFARLARAGVARLYWSIGIGAAAGVTAALLALLIHERVRQKSRAARLTHALTPHLNLAASRGEHSS
jgi:multidrug efflux pump